MKAMEQNNWFGTIDIRIGAISGAICAVLKLLDIYLLTDTYFVVLLKVGVTAVIGGGCGVLGKHLVTYCIEKWKKYFTKNKPS